MANYIKELREKIGHKRIFMPASGVIILNDKDEILLQLRVDNNTWAIHGGAIEIGEDSLTAAKRECQEETGLEVENLKLFKVFEGPDRFNTYPNGDMIQAVEFIYYTYDYKGELKMQESEVSKLAWFSLDNLPANIFIPNQKVLSEFIEFMKK